MLFEELHVALSDSTNVPFSERTRAPGCITIVSRMSRSTRVVWRQLDPRDNSLLDQAFAESYDQEFTVEPDRVAVDEKQIQLAERKTVWLYATIDVDSKVVREHDFLHDEGRNLRRGFSGGERETLVEDTEFLVDSMGYLTALARTGLSGELNYSGRNIVGKLFQTYTMRIGRFHETRNGSQVSAEHWLTTYYYNHHWSHQALGNQSSIKVLKQGDSI